MDLYSFRLIQDISDFINFIKFKRQIKKERKNPNSTFNKLKLKRNWLGNILYAQIDCDDTELMNFDYNIDRMVQKRLKPYSDYLGAELGWSDYITLDVRNFVDDENVPSLSYGVLFLFEPYSLTMTRAMWYLILNILLIGGIITAVTLL